MLVESVDSFVSQCDQSTSGNQNLSFWLFEIRAETFNANADCPCLIASAAFVRWHTHVVETEDQIF